MPIFHRSNKRLSGSRIHSRFDRLCSRKKRVLFFAAFCVFTSAGNGACGSTEERASVTLEAAPRSEQVSKSVLHNFGWALHQAIVDNELDVIRLNDVELSDALNSTARTRWAAVRAWAENTLEPSVHDTYAGTRYIGLCAQGFRPEEADGVFGLRSPSWVGDRVLLVVEDDRQMRRAAWIEGPFLLTTRGIRAITFGSIEALRWQHSDLEIATCDLRAGNW